MKLSKSFTLPEEDPIVPEYLAERITDWLPSATKIDVKRRSHGGWRVLTTIQLDGSEDPSDVYTMIKAYADYDADRRGEAGKYRALVWRNIPGSGYERRRVTFSVQPSYYEQEEESSGTDERPLLREVWQDLYGAQQEFIRDLMGHCDRSTNRVLEQSKQDAERLSPLSDIIHELVGPYRDGLRMKADAVREVGEMRVREQLAHAKAADSHKFWEMFGPAIQVAAAQAQKRLFSGSEPKRKALPAATRMSRAVEHEAVVERRTVQTAAAPPAAPPQSPPPSQPPSPPQRPVTLHELAAALLHGLGADTLVKLTRQLEQVQAAYLETIASTNDDDTSADAIVALMQSLMSSPATVVRMQQLLTPDQLGALQQLAVLATRYVEERAQQPAGQRSEAASPGSGDAASLDLDDADE